MKGNLEGLIPIDDLADLPDGEGVVDVHPVDVPLGHKQEGWLLPVVVTGEGLVKGYKVSCLKLIKQNESLVHFTMKLKK